jgi:hypothetical protein
MLGALMAVAVAIADPETIEVEVTLRGSPASMERQRAVADRHGLPSAATLDDLERLREEGHLVEVPGAATYEVASWVFPYAVPEVRRFVERLAGRYVEACGEPLVVTSLTRPLSEQPPNAHALSVHPNGMAADFRIPRNPACREWIEAEFLDLEERGVIDATRERAPPHYHVAVFPEAFARFTAAEDTARAQAVFGGGSRERTPEAANRGGGGVGWPLLALLAGCAMLGLAGWTAALRRRRSRD